MSHVHIVINESEKHFHTENKKVWGHWVPLPDPSRWNEKFCSRTIDKDCNPRRSNAIHNKLCIFWWKTIEENGSIDERPFQAVICLGQVYFKEHVVVFSPILIHFENDLPNYDSIIAFPPILHETRLKRTNDIF